MSSKPQPPCTGATYTIHTTSSGYGSLSNIHTLPKQLISHHLSFKPQTPRHDVTAINCGYRNDEIFTGGNEGKPPFLSLHHSPFAFPLSTRLLKVVIEVRRGAWTATDKRTLIERVHGLLVQWKGKKAEKTDIVVQLTEIEDCECVMRNGRWGMWEGAVPGGGSGEPEDGASMASSVEKPAVG